MTGSCGSSPDDGRGTTSVMLVKPFAVDILRCVGRNMRIVSKGERETDAIELGIVLAGLYALRRRR